MSSDINVQTFSGKVNINNNLLVGSGHLFVDTQNNLVGLRTSDPQAGLHVESNTYVRDDFRVGSGIVMNETTGQITAGSFVGDGSGITSVNSDSGSWVNGTDVVHLATTGDNVGIGTTTPQQKLEVHGNILLGQNDIASFIHGGQVTALSSDTNILIVSDANDTTGALGGDIIFGSGSSIDMDANRDFTFAEAYPSSVPRLEHMRIVGSNGRVGIGTSSPDTILHVEAASNPQILVEDTGSANQSTIRFKTATTDWAVGQHGGETGKFKIANHTLLGTNDHITIDTSGNVGIGKTDPDAMLHVNGNVIVGDVGAYGSAVTHQDAQLTLGGTHNTGYNLSNKIKLLISGGNNDGSSPYYIMCEDENGYDQFYVKGATSDGGSGQMYMKGNVGVGLTNPGTVNSVPSTSVDHHVVGRYIVSEPSDDEHWSISTSNNFELKRSINGVGYIDAARIEFNTGAYVDLITFTGQHRSSHIENVTPRMASEYEGLIVCANRDNYESVNGDKKRGNRAITVNEAVPLLSLSSSAMDKTCFGVISNSEDPDNRIQKFGNFSSHHLKMNGDEHIFINSIGEGGIWVVNANGPLESGDYITTSNIHGYGMKQDNQFLANYTVAKITMNCNFNPQVLPIQCIVQQEKVVTKYLDIKNNIVSTEEESHSSYETNENVNILDEHGQIQWEDSDETEASYKLRYLLPNGTQISEEEYTTRALADERVFIAAFVGCTYHCG